MVARKMSRQEAGRKGAEARWGKSYSSERSRSHAASASRSKSSSRRKG